MPDGCRSSASRCRLKPVPQQTMYSKFCGYAKAKINVCPNVGWIKDFPDP